MAKPWGSVEAARGSAGISRTGGGGFFFLAIVFIVVGVIGEAADVCVGLEPMSWYLLGIAAFLSSITWWIGWATAILIDVIETSPKQ